MRIVFFAAFLVIPFTAFAQTARQFLSLGNDELQQGRLDEAIVDFTRAIDANPNLEKGFNNRGVAYAKEGSYQRAIDDFTLAIAEDPKDPEPYNNRGLAYSHQGRLKQSLVDYTRAIRLNTFYEKAYINRAVAYFRLKEYDKAWSDVHTLQAIGGHIDPRFVDALKQASAVG